MTYSIYSKQSGTSAYNFQGKDCGIEPQEGTDYVNKEEVNGKIVLKFFHPQTNEERGIEMSVTLGEQVQPNKNGSDIAVITEKDNNGKELNYNIALIEIKAATLKDNSADPQQQVEIKPKIGNKLLEIGDTLLEIKPSNSAETLNTSDLEKAIMAYLGGDSISEFEADKRGNGFGASSLFSMRKMLGLDYLKDTAPIDTDACTPKEGQAVEAKPSVTDLILVFLCQIFDPYNAFTPKITCQGIDPSIKEPALDKHGNPITCIIKKAPGDTGRVIYAVFFGLGAIFLTLTLTIWGSPIAMIVLFSMMMFSPITLGLVKALYKNNMGLSILAGIMAGLFQASLTKLGEAKSGWKLGWAIVSFIAGIVAAVTSMPIGIVNKQTPLDNVKLPYYIQSKTVTVLIVFFKYFAKNIGRVAIILLAIGVIGLAGSGSSLAFIAAIPALSSGWVGAVLFTYPALAVNILLYPILVPLSLLVPGSVGLVATLQFSTAIVSAMATSATALATIQAAAIIAAIWVLYPSARGLIQMIKDIGSPPHSVHDMVKHKSPGEGLSFLESIVAILKNVSAGGSIREAVKQFVNVVAAELFLLPLKEIESSIKLNSLYGADGELIENIDLENYIAFKQIKEIKAELDQNQPNDVVNDKFSEEKLQKFKNIIDYYHKRLDKNEREAELALEEWRANYNKLDKDFLAYLELEPVQLSKKDFYPPKKSKSPEEITKRTELEQKAIVIAYKKAEDRAFKELTTKIIEASDDLPGQKNALKNVLQAQIKHEDDQLEAATIDSDADSALKDLLDGDSGILHNNNNNMEAALKSFSQRCRVSAENNPANTNGFNVLMKYVQRQTIKLLRNEKEKNDLNKEITEKARTLAYANYAPPQDSLWNKSFNEIADSLLGNTSESFSNDKSKEAANSIKDRIMDKSKEIIEHVEQILTEGTGLDNKIANLVEKGDKTIDAVKKDNKLIKYLAENHDPSKLIQYLPKDSGSAESTNKTLKFDEDKKVASLVKSKLHDVRSDVGLTSDKAPVNGSKRWFTFFTLSFLGLVGGSVALFIFPVVIATIGPAGLAFVMVFLGLASLLTFTGIITFAADKSVFHRVKVFFKDWFGSDNPEYDILSANSTTLELIKNNYGSNAGDNGMSKFILRLRKLRMAVDEYEEKKLIEKDHNDHNDYNDDTGEARKYDKDESVIEESDRDLNEIDPINNKGRKRKSSLVPDYDDEL